MDKNNNINQLSDNNISQATATNDGNIQSTDVNAEKQRAVNALSSFWKDIKSYFNLSQELEPQIEAEQSIRSSISFKGSQLLVLIFAIFIASLGLNTDSVPVIIGAMLISPLMGPIIGMGLAIGIQDFPLLKKGFKNISMAVIGSLVTSAIYFLISPQYEGASQLLARTSPSIYDVFVALFGGGAGIVSIACKNKGQVMPGVAIATSLMPPLCTAGYGIAHLNAHYFFGALYLFFTNMIFILFATWIGVKLLRYKKVDYQSSVRAKRIRYLMYSILACTVAISAYLTVIMIRTNIFMAEATAFVENQMVFPNTQVLTHKEYIDKGRRYIDVTLIGQALPKDSLQLAMMNKLDSIGLGGTVLNIKQGFAMNAEEAKMEAGDYDKFYSLLQNQIASSENTIDSLKSVIDERHAFFRQSAVLAPEMKVLFPQVKEISTAKMLLTSTQTDKCDTISVLFVNAPSGLSSTERKKLKEYAAVRLQQPNLTLSVNPTNFPWK